MDRNIWLKVVPDPISGLIDIRSVLPIVETREFQSLRDKRQLGMTYLVFPAATHSRFIHSLGAYKATKSLADRWRLQGLINEEERRGLPIYALLHDIGHGAFSHTTEDFCDLDNNQMSLKIVRERFKPYIADSGADPMLVETLVSHEHLLSKAVHDKNLGMEKLDYLERDGYYTLSSRPPGIEYLRNYVYYDGGEIAIDGKVAEYALEALDFYMKMYKEVYLRKSLVIAQRMFHKMVYRLILAGELFARNLPHMTDSELLALFYGSSEPLVQKLYARLRERGLFKEAISIRPEAFIGETRIAYKSIRVFGATPEEMHHLINSPFLQRRNNAELEETEAKIAKISGIPADSLLVVPVFYPERFRAKDVLIYEMGKKLCSLKERRPAHFQSMEETARSYTALRICTQEEYREKLSSPAVSSAVIDLVLTPSGLTK